MPAFNISAILEGDISCLTITHICWLRILCRTTLRGIFVLQWPNSSRRVSEVRSGDFKAKFSIKGVQSPFKSHILIKLLHEHTDEWLLKVKFIDSCERR